MSTSLCSLCKDPQRKILQRGKCYDCYTTERNSIRLYEIERKFTSAGAFGAWIFGTYLSDVRQGKLRRNDVYRARRLASILSQEDVSEPRSWKEALILSERLEIRYSIVPKLGCPILRLARDLEKEGKIPKREEVLIESHENLLWVFDPKTRELLERYVAEISPDHRSPRTALIAASQVRKLYRFLRGKDLFDLSQDSAQTFLKSLRPKRVATVSDTQNQLKRFYGWSIRNGLCRKNPFDGWEPEGHIRCCKKCGKTSAFSYHDQICDLCRIYARTLAKFDRLVDSYKAPSPYNQYLFDLYVKYIRRTITVPEYLFATQQLIRFLDSKPLPAIRSWRTIASLSQELSQKQARPIRLGCPFIKIGRMLQELGVLPIRQTDREVALEVLFSKYPMKTSQILRRYDEQLVKMRYSMHGRHGTVRTVFDLQNWITENDPGLDLFTLSQQSVLEYLRSLNKKDKNGLRRYTLKRFYRWAQIEKLTLINPFEGIPIPVCQ